jgi:hypothetical protein
MKLHAAAGGGCTLAKHSMSFEWNVTPNTEQASQVHTSPSYLRILPLTSLLFLHFLLMQLRQPRILPSSLGQRLLMHLPRCSL